jgi:hypothetical protein
MSFNENKGLWLMVSLTVAAAAALIWVLLSAQPLRLVILYSDVGDLKRDDPVVWRGVTIGKVEDIRPFVDNQLGVTIRIREDHKSKLSHGTEFILKKASFFGLVGNNAIEVVTPSSPGTPFSSGEKVHGKVISKPSLVEQGKKWSQEYWQQLKAETGQLIDALKSSPYRKEAVEELDQLKTLAEQGAREAKEGLEDFRKAHQNDLDEILKRLERLRDEMRRKGDGTSATQVEKEIDRVRGNPQQP